jgi:hypothetical protein
MNEGGKGEGEKGKSRQEEGRYDSCCSSFSNTNLTKRRMLNSTMSSSSHGDRGTALLKTESVKPRY